MTGTRKESVLTCASVHEAQNIIDHLFTKQLISRAEILPTSIENEVKLILENLEEDINQIKQEIVALIGKEAGIQVL
jgi:hypothetical protein